MLKRLKRKFIVIVMVLVGTVLIAVLGSSYVSTARAKDEIITSSLEHTIHRGMESFPMLGEQPRNSDPQRSNNLLSLLVDVSVGGIVLQTSDAPVAISSEALADVIMRVVVDGQTEGTDPETHLAWLATTLDEGGWRIAIVDTSTNDAMLRNLAIHDVIIVLVALTVLFAITWWLANWALRPVEEAWEQQRRFVADASHELKTPLAVILANLQILKADPGIGDDARPWVESTEEEAQHMKALVGDLLQLAQADESVAGSAHSAMRHEDIDLSDLVESATLEFDAVAFERGCLLESEVEEGIRVTGDPEWMERLVRILIDNACKYGAEGTTVNVRLARAGGKSALSVHNMGTPIDEEDLPHVFERFYRSDRARTREGEGGFGLGLAIAKSIVDAHGGTISVTSTEQDGTTFSVTL